MVLTIRESRRAPVWHQLALFTQISFLKELSARETTEGPQFKRGFPVGTLYPWVEDVHLAAFAGSKFLLGLTMWGGEGKIFAGVKIGEDSLFWGRWDAGEPKGVTSGPGGWSRSEGKE